MPTPQPAPVDFRKQRPGTVECRFMGNAFPSARDPQAHRGDVVWIDPAEQKAHPALFVPIAEERAKKAAADAAAANRNDLHMQRRAQFAARADDAAEAARIQAQRDAEAAARRAADLERAASKPRRAE